MLLLLLFTQSKGNAPNCCSQLMVVAHIIFLANLNIFLIAVKLQTLLFNILHNNNMIMNTVCL